MTEKLNSSDEQKNELPVNYQEISKKIERQHEQAAESARDEPEQSVKQLEDSAKNEAESASDLGKAHRQDKAETAYAPPNEQLLQHALNQSLTKIRRHLTGRQKQFSKVIHNPAVDKISDISGSTVARPSGLLVGGLFSLISSFSLLIICRHYGYEYNYLLAILSFVGGFALGLFLEAIMRLVRKTT